MKDQLISFETAKLAKDKGFDLKTPKYYTTENPHSYHKDLDGVCILGLLHSNSLYEPQNEIDEETGISLYRLDYSTVYAPTQSLLQKWLREVHNIHVYADCNHSGWFWNVEKTNGTTIKYFEMLNNESGHYNTHEEALETGLQEALKLIKLS
jgi:hypothetical protein